MQVGELAEQGFLQAVLVEQAEIGVVGHGNHVAATFGDFLDGGHQGVSLGHGRCVAARVVGEVEQHHYLALLLGGILQHCLEGVDIVAAGDGEGRVLFHDGAGAGTEGQVVVAPEHVRQYQMVTLVDEHVRDDGKPVGEGVGDDRVAEVLPLLARVLAQHLFAPQGAQFRFARGRRIRVDVLGIEGGELVLNAGKEHGTAVFGGDADGGVEFVGFFLRLGGLGQDSLGEEEIFAEIGQHLQDVRAVLG